MPEGVQISPQPSEVGSVSVQNVVRKFIGKTTAPTVNDDITLGYIVSDMWIDETGDKAYQCLDNTDGAAVWEQLAGDGQDHGVLAGLTDDDHTQYVLRGAIRHTINSGEDYVIKDNEQRLVYDELATNGSGSVTIDGSGELVVGMGAGHTHSELSASDGDPSPALSVDANGNVNVLVGNVNFPVDSKGVTFGADAPNAVMYYDGDNDRLVVDVTDDAEDPATLYIDNYTYFNNTTTMRDNYAFKWMDGATEVARLQGALATGLSINGENVPITFRTGVNGLTERLLITAAGDLVFNPGYNDDDFSIYKLTTGVAVAYDAGDDATSIGDGGVTNYTQLAGDGGITQAGTARINWTKIAASGVTLGDGPPTSSDVVADLQTAHDNRFYVVDEDSSSAGQNLIVDFAGVTAFNWVQILGYYDGQATHHLDTSSFNLK